MTFSLITLIDSSLERQFTEFCGKYYSITIQFLKKLIVSNYVNDNFNFLEIHLYFSVMYDKAIFNYTAFLIVQIGHKFKVSAMLIRMQINTFEKSRNEVNVTFSSFTIL